MIQLAPIDSDIRFFSIEDDGDTVGTVAIDVFEDHIVLGEPSVSEAGTGSTAIKSLIIKGVLLRAELLGVPVRMSCDRNSSAIALYQEHGFTVRFETAREFCLERMPDTGSNPNCLLA